MDVLELRILVLNDCRIFYQTIPELGPLGIVLAVGVGAVVVAGVVCYFVRRPGR